MSGPTLPAVTTLFANVPVLGVDLVTAVAFVLLVAGFVGSVLPSVPGPLLSLAGVLTYWWGTGFTEPGTIVLVVLLATGVIAILADWFGGLVATRAGGASTTTTLIAGVVGLVLLFAVGPAGVLVGAAGTVFVIEYTKQHNAKAGMKAASAYVLGFFASAMVQALLTLSMLVSVFGVAFT